MKQNNEIMNYTSIEQSKHLLELGLSPDSADMKLNYDYNEHRNVEIPMMVTFKNWDDPYNKAIPCWSVGALLEIIWKSLPSVMLIPGSRFDIEPQYWCTTDNEEICYDTDYYASAIEALYDMICWLLQNNYIKTKQS